jgi:predicted Zn-dependent protease
MISRYRCTTQMLAAWLVMALLAMPGGAVVAAPELPDPGQPRMTRDEQKQLGLQVAGQVYSQMPVLPDSSPETKYIEALGRRLFTTIPVERSWPFQFHVVAQKEINAFALPGGPMFVNIGTITAAENEAQLAGVMAHEMAHVYMQHSAKQQEKGSLLEGLAGLAGAVAGSVGGTLGTLAQTGIQVGAGTLMLKYSRGDEAQADAVGAIILWKAGFNPVALADFFEKLQAQGAGSGPQFLSDHPNPGNRRDAIQKEIAQWPARRYSGNSADFASVRMHATKVKAYTAQEIAAGAKSGQWAPENRRNGAVFADAPVTAGAAASTPNPPSSAPPPSVPPASWTDVQPSQNFQSANLGNVRIDRPENWGVLGGSQSSATIAPRAGVTGDAVAYGVVIRADKTPAANMPADRLAAAIIQGLRSGDSKMRQLGDIEAITVNGTSAATVELETISPMTRGNGRSQRERDWLVAIPRGQNEVLYLVFVSPLASYDDLRPTFERMLQSLRF